MSHHTAPLRPAAAPHVEYRRHDPEQPLAEKALAAVVFGEGRAVGNDPRLIQVGLQPLYGAGLAEIWQARDPVRTGREGPIRYACDAEHLFGVIELDEREQGGIIGASEAAYAAIRQFLQTGEHPHVLRVWNYFDAINGGAGDAERYRQFCTGRAAGLGSQPDGEYPAATAIGRRDGDATLQIYWLAARTPGVALENPRQVNPTRYPRVYGPTSPQFSRAMRIADGLVMVSGTASIVGHASHHSGDLLAQLDESLANLRSVLHQATVELDGRSLLKIYLRETAAAGQVESWLRERLAADIPFLILGGDICRSDLLVEVECIHDARSSGRRP